MKSGLSIVSFLFCAFGVVSKTHHCTQGHADFRLCYLLEASVLHCAFSSVIHFQWFLKVKACEEDFFFLSVISSHLSTICLKTFSSPLYWLPSFVKEQVIIFMGIHFWVLQSVSLFCLFFHQHHTVLITLLVQFSRSVMSDSLRSHELQHAWPPCPSPTPGVYSNSCPSSPWCHPAISSSVVPFSAWPQSLPASGSFPMSQLFTSGGQSIGVSASASVLPMNTQDWSPLGWTGWISLSKELSRVFSNTIVQNNQFFGTQLSSQSNFHIHTWPLEKP